MSLASTNHVCSPLFPPSRTLLHRWNEIKEITRLIRERNIEGMVRLFVLGTILTFHSELFRRMILRVYGIVYRNCIVSVNMKSIIYRQLFCTESRGNNKSEIINFTVLYTEVQLNIVISEFSILIIIQDNKFTSKNNFRILEVLFGIIGIIVGNKSF